MPGDLTLSPALRRLLEHWTVLLHGQHLLLHLHGLHHSRFPQPAQGIPLLEETPHLQGLLRQGDQALAVVHALLPVSAPHCCKHFAADQSEGALFLESAFLPPPRVPQDDAKLPLPLCLQLSPSAQTRCGLTADALCVWESSPRPPLDLHIPFPGRAR